MGHKQMIIDLHIQDINTSNFKKKYEKRQENFKFAPVLN
jgi:hypothetical protein